MVVRYSVSRVFLGQVQVASSRAEYNPAFSLLGKSVVSARELCGELDQWVSADFKSGPGAWSAESSLDRRSVGLLLRWRRRRMECKWSGVEGYR